MINSLRAGNYLPLEYDEVKHLKSILSNKETSLTSLEVDNLKKKRALASRRSRISTFSTCSSVDSNDRESRPPSKLLLPPIPDRNSSINNPKLGSSSEREADVWQDRFEHWCNKRAIKPALKVTLKDKVALRSWFAKLDEDGSGEVSIDELENPMISAGILKTRDDCKKCLVIWDKDNSNTISFDEFVDALRGNELVDKKKLEALREYSHDPVFSMDTLLTAERRRNIFRFVLSESAARSRSTDEAARSLYSVASNINNLSNASSSNYQNTCKKFEELEKDIAVDIMKNDVYLSSLEAVVKRHTAMIAAVDFLQTAPRHVKKDPYSLSFSAKVDYISTTNQRSYKEYARAAPKKSVKIKSLDANNLEY